MSETSTARCPIRRQACRRQHDPLTAHQPGCHGRPPRRRLQGRSLLVANVHHTGAARSPHHRPPLPLPMTIRPHPSLSSTTG
jgi:hypothetical protein